MLALGIDIGGTSVKAALLLDGRVVAESRSDPYHRPIASQLSAAVAQVVPRSPPDAIGVCLPGAWDEARGVVSASINVPGVVGVAPHELLGYSHSPFVRVFTDARAAAFDVFETERLDQRLFAVSIGTGVGAAVIDPGGSQLLCTGRSSGHFGQIDVTVPEPGIEAPIGPDGGRGGLEAYVGLHALLTRYGGSPADIPARFGPDDPPLIALARSLRIAHAIYRPIHFRLLGGLGIRLSPMIAGLRTMVEDGLTSVARPGWTLRCGTSDHHAARGAAALAAREFTMS